MAAVLEDRQAVKLKKPIITIPYKYGDSNRIRSISDCYNIQGSLSQESLTRTVSAISKTLLPPNTRVEPHSVSAAVTVGSSAMEKLAGTLLKDYQSTSSIQ